ncbi:MAG: UDP-N-acetylmuramoyl-L-alanyl-D-glutamate--2,6-diaminopimelate ligase, partial [bacterium]
MINLNKIIEYIKPQEIINSVNLNLEEIKIKEISYNSKTTKQGDLFVCLVGEHTDGHNFAAQAQEKGSLAIIAQKNIKNISIPIIIVKDTQLALSQISAIFYNFPSQNLRLIGITGTNGKTTVTHLVENIFEKAGISCSLIGTLGQRFSSKDEYISTKHTTPQAPDLQQSLKAILDKGINHVVMEVSSHSLEQHRVSECQFDAAVLTNLTQDHLDYHITMDNYFKAKSKLFSSLKENNKADKYAVINNDDESANSFIQIIPAGIRILTYGIRNNADIMAKNIEFSLAGSKFECKTPVGSKIINLQMPGQFSVYNALAALAVGIAEKIDLNICIEAL